MAAIGELNAVGALEAPGAVAARPAYESIVGGERVDASRDRPGLLPNNFLPRHHHLLISERNTPTFPLPPLRPLLVLPHYRIFSPNLRSSPYAPANRKPPISTLQRAPFISLPFARFLYDIRIRPRDSNFSSKPPAN